MKKLALLLVVASLLVASPKISFGVEAGTILLDECRQALKGPDSYGLNFIAAARCFGYLEGITNTNFWYQRMKTDTAFCLPENSITNNEAATIVVKYLEKHPEDLRKPKFLLVLDAFKESFPCR